MDTTTRMQACAHSKTAHMPPKCSRIPISLQLHTCKWFLTNFITSTNIQLLYIYGANDMLLRIARLNYSKRKQCNCQDTNSGVQQYNIHTTSNQKGTIILLKCHCMPANSYCLVLYLAPASIKSNI